MKKFIRVGIDLAKNYFEVHAQTSERGTAVTRKLSRSKMRRRSPRWLRLVKDAKFEDPCIRTGSHPANAG